MPTHVVRKRFGLAITDRLGRTGLVGELLRELQCDVAAKAETVVYEQPESLNIARGNGLGPAVEKRKVLADFGVTLPDETKVRVWDSTAETRFIVLPMRPAATEGWSEEKLAELVTRDSMIGTRLADAPGQGSQP